MQACTSPRLMTGLYLMLSNPKVKDVKDRLQNILEREGEQPEVVVHVGTNDVGKKWKEVLQRCCIIGCHSTATILWRSTKSSSYPHSGEGTVVKRLFQLTIIYQSISWTTSKMSLIYFLHGSQGDRDIQRDGVG
ncbi:uncharacterized protein LOC144593977 isoform X4 [Rhinoraja longicauda]